MSDFLVAEGVARQFEPPAVADVPPVLPGTRGRRRDLFQRLGNRPRGRTVINESGVFSTVDASVVPQSRLDAATAVYLGGHIHDVTDAEAAALEGAGFSVGSVDADLLTEAGDPIVTEG